MKKEYEDIEAIKALAERLGFDIGPVSWDEDEPFLKVQLTLLKRRENE